MKQITSLIKRYKMGGHLSILILLVAIKACLASGYEKIFSEIVSNITNDKIWYYLILFIICNILLIVLKPAIYHIYKNKRYEVEKKYREDLFQKACNLPVKKLQNFKMAKLTNAINTSYTVMDNIHSIIRDMTHTIVYMISSFIILFTTDAKFTLIITIYMLLLMVIIFFLEKNVGSHYKKIRQKGDELNIAISRLEGYLTIKNFNRIKFEIQNYRKISDELHNVSLKRSYANIVSSLVINGGYTILEIGIILYMIFMIGDNNMLEQTANCIVFYNLSGRMFAPLIELPDIIDTISRTLVNIKNNNEILELDDEYDGHIDIKEIKDSIEFKNVSFSYENNKIFDSLNLKIPKGSKIGIYGDSGAGKSTIFNLLNRHFLVDSGEITIDGTNINHFTNESIRRIIGNVNQEIFIFSDMSIKDNIKYGLEVSDEEVIRVAKLANAHEFINKLEKGYDSLIGNNGVKLSGGERQRLTIARLMLYNPSILLLDEATSKLDNNTEEKIKDGINKLSEGKTIISIAHRLNTIEDYDILIGVQDGHVVEYGPADEIKANGKLWNSLVNI